MFYIFNSGLKFAYRNLNLNPISLNFKIEQLISEHGNQKCNQSTFRFFNLLINFAALLNDCAIFPEIFNSRLVGVDVPS